MTIIRPRGEAHKPRWQSSRTLGEQKKLSYAKELKGQNRQGKGACLKCSLFFSSN